MNSLESVYTSSWVVFQHSGHSKHSCFHDGLVFEAEYCSGEGSKNLGTKLGSAFSTHVNINLIEFEAVTEEEKMLCLGIFS